MINQKGKSEMRRWVVLLALLALNAGIALSQSTKPAAQAKPQLATARVHIDGFPKSKSGAI
jgi:hypothetical protein